MKYLSPEIEAWSKQLDTKSLVRPGVSCGIFQDCNANEVIPVPKQQEKTKTKDK
ncbi:hypothetical protein [Formosa sp. PL04]|uniref:hypothetical protein n=1 Tax=Formosa sp. PL04 TaxID=3081755 RepID=UPI0029824510|nr:hypothetical protein [Formosa sp. PL04]MDW5289494.1 hypothetical protein [Formosa sp. PL04]